MVDSWGGKLELVDWFEFWQSVPGPAQAANRKASGALAGAAIMGNEPCPRCHQRLQRGHVEAWKFLQVLHAPGLEACPEDLDVP